VARKPDPALTALAKRLACELLAAACANDTPNMPLAGRLEEAAPAVLGPHLKLEQKRGPMARKHWDVNLKLTVHGDTKEEALAFATQLLQELTNTFDEEAGLAGTEVPTEATENVDPNCAICDDEEG